MFFINEMIISDWITLKPEQQSIFKENKYGAPLFANEY